MLPFPANTPGPFPLLVTESPRPRPGGALPATGLLKHSGWLLDWFFIRQVNREGHIRVTVSQVNRGHIRVTT